jgi:hypothetical protein
LTSKKNAAAGSGNAGLKSPKICFCHWVYSSKQDIAHFYNETDKLVFRVSFFCWIFMGLALIN